MYGLFTNIYLNKKKIKHSPVFIYEALFWFSGLLWLYFMPLGHERSFCLFKFLGFSSCPGCGLGHAIHYALNGDFVTSWHYHKLGLPALCILITRILNLLVKQIKDIKG